MTKIAIVALCHFKHQKLLSARASSLQKYLKCSTNIQLDNLIFEDKPLKDKTKADCCSVVDTKFINVWDAPTPKLKESCKEGESIGYKGMCLFYAMEILHYLKDYDYCLRLDADSTLHSPLNLDEFIDGNYTYGYVRDKFDIHEPTKLTLPPAIKEYIDDNKINTICSKKEIDCWNYYNNFHITKLDFWRQKEVTDFLKYIYNQGGIRDHRWGDSTIQANAVRMFCPKEKIIKLDLKYRHASHDWQNF